MTRRRLLLVVGAGASVEFGMPSVGDVRAIIDAVAQQRYPLRYDPSTNLYRCIEDMVDRYWRQSIPPHLRRAPHFEDLLYTIFALAAAYPASADTSAIGALITATKLPEVNAFGRQPSLVGRDTLRDLGNASVDGLVEAFRERCRAAEVDKIAEFTELQALCTALRSEFEVAIVTLNYDNIAYRAFPGVETGFVPATGLFEQGRILDRSDWACMLHLHGSVHFDMTGIAGDMHGIRWQPDIQGPFHQNAGGRSTRSYVEGADFPTSVIVAGYGKTTQILRRPFRTYYSELDRLVAGCDALLIAGYGFGDVHLNMAFESFRDGRRRPVAVIGHAPDDAMPFGHVDLGERSPMSDALIRTFETDWKAMRSLGSALPDTVEALKAAQEFETCLDPATPLSLWYNGMLAACADPDKVLARLR